MEVFKMRKQNDIYNQVKSLIKNNKFSKIEVCKYNITTYYKNKNYFGEVLIYKDNNNFISLKSSYGGKYNEEYIDFFIDNSLEQCRRIYNELTKINIIYREIDVVENTFNFLYEGVKDESSIL